MTHLFIIQSRISKLPNNPQNRMEKNSKNPPNSTKYFQTSNDTKNLLENCLQSYKKNSTLIVIEIVICLKQNYFLGKLFF
jgi:hypothetical protein